MGPLYDIERAVAVCTQCSRIRVVHNHAHHPAICATVIMYWCVFQRCTPVLKLLGIWSRQDSRPSSGGGPSGKALFERTSPASATRAAIPSPSVDGPGTSPLDLHAISPTTPGSSAARAAALGGLPESPAHQLPARSYREHTLKDSPAAGLCTGSQPSPSASGGHDAGLLQLSPALAAAALQPADLSDQSRVPGPSSSRSISKSPGSTRRQLPPSPLGMQAVTPDGGAGPAPCAASTAEEGPLPSVNPCSPVLRQTPVAAASPVPDMQAAIADAVVDEMAADAAQSQTHAPPCWPASPLAPVAESPLGQNVGPQEAKQQQMRVRAPLQELQPECAPQPARKRRNTGAAVKACLLANSGSS